MSASHSRSQSVSLPGEPEDAAAARRFLRRALVAWQAEALEASASLLLSELVANAVLHARTEIQVRIVLSDDALRLEVADRSNRPPRHRHYDLDAATGRGIALVAAMARSWGVEPTAEGKVVWCELDASTLGHVRPRADRAAGDHTGPRGRVKDETLARPGEVSAEPTSSSVNEREAAA